MIDWLGNSAWQRQARGDEGEFSLEPRGSLSFRRAAARAFLYARDMDAAQGAGLIIAGPPRSGKTRLLGALAKAAAEGGRRVTAASLGGLITALRSGWPGRQSSSPSHYSSEEAALFPAALLPSEVYGPPEIPTRAQLLLEADCLLVDETGRRGLDWLQAEIVSRLLYERALARRPTVLATREAYWSDGRVQLMKPLLSRLACAMGNDISLHDDYYYVWLGDRDDISE